MNTKKKRNKKRYKIYGTFDQVSRVIVVECGVWEFSSPVAACSWVQCIGLQSFIPRHLPVRECVWKSSRGWWDGEKCGIFFCLSYRIITSILKLIIPTWCVSCCRVWKNKTPLGPVELHPWHRDWQWWWWVSIKVQSPFNSLSIPLQSLFNHISSTFPSLIFNILVLKMSGTSCAASPFSSVPRYFSLHALPKWHMMCVHLWASNPFPVLIIVLAWHFLPPRSSFLF